MWRDWQPEVVDADLEKLSRAGLQWLRVFPLWPDFQPIHQLRGHSGAKVEMRLGEDPLPLDPIGQAGLSAMMLDRFDVFADLASKHRLRLVVGLITGWMSGRLFVPPALEGLDPITDPTSMAWQVRFVTGFVGRMNGHAAIAAWDLGNECNCMGVAPTPDAAFVWTATIANAIRAADPARAVVSGMHSLSTPHNPIGNAWTIDDQAALTDVLTTHPYPYWVRHTNADAVDTLRTTLHATAESRFYADIGGKPCIAEEIGTMGPMIAGDDVSAGFARVNMLSLWANDCRAMAWWCAHDQTDLVQAPYDWNGVELELGLLRNDGSAKPVLQEMTAMRGFIDSLPFPSLIKPVTDAICILSRNQDDWAVAFGTYVLAKQAKLEIAFRHIGQSIPDAPLYLLPSLKGADCVPRRVWLDLLGRVRAGATLYISLGDGILPGFDAAAGIAFRTRAKPTADMSVTLGDGTVLDLLGGDDLRLEMRSGEVLGMRKDSATPGYWKNRLGAGEVHVFAAPIEDQLTRCIAAFDAPDAKPYWRVYEAAAEKAVAKRLVQFRDPQLAMTEHAQSDGSTVVCVINHGSSEKALTPTLRDGARIVEVWRGTVDPAGQIHISPLDGCLIKVRC